MAPTNTTQSLRMISWNVNGLRAMMKKGFPEIFASFDADIVALQETKMQEADRVTLALDLPGYYQTWNYAERKGYSGTCVFSREEPRSVRYGFEGDRDNEGRICALEFDTFWFVDVYTPNSQDGLARIGYRMAWDDSFRDFLCDLACSKPVVACGDLNVAHNDIDLKNPDLNRGTPGFSDQERNGLTRLLDAGFTDTFRLLHPDTTGAYTWWNYLYHARATNAGWRIDYFLVSNDVVDCIKDASILSDVQGSDHCPIELDITL